MKSMYFQNGTQKLRTVIDLSVRNPNVKNVTLDWDSDGSTHVIPRFTKMTEKEFWHFINSSGFKSVKEFS